MHHPFAKLRLGPVDVGAIALGVDERVRPITTRLQALTTFSTRSPSRTGNDHEVQPRVWPPVTCAVSAIGPTRIVSPSLNRCSTRVGG